MSKHITIRVPLTSDEATAYSKRLKKALIAASGNVCEAAKALGMPRRTLDDHIMKLGLRSWLTAAYNRSVRQPCRA
jgi:transcriptional regulator with GAF, ATPase, and Fis domain